MTDLTLTRQQLESGSLPKVCVATGQQVEALTDLPVGPAKIPAVAGLPAGILPAAVVERISGSVVKARVGRAPGVRTKQLAVTGLRALMTLFFLLRFLGGLTGGDLMGMVTGLLGIVAVAVIGGAFLNKVLTVGFVVDEDSVVISGAHPDFVAALEGGPEVAAAAPVAAVGRQLTKPVVAPGLY